MQQGTIGTDVAVSASGLMTAGCSARPDSPQMGDLLRATVDRGATVVDTADIQGRHADHEPGGETRTVVATQRHATARTSPIRPFPRFRS
jgi:aryl-alcohol dehydrogenase-like predicted oxidoreductase